MSLVTVSVVCYNTNLDIITRCLESIEAQNIDWKGVFVDHSKMGIYKTLLENRSKWKYIERGAENDGFGGGNNAAFSFVENSKYFLLVNPDVYLYPDTIKKLIGIISQDTSIGLITGKIYYPDGTLQKLNKRNPTVYALLGRRFKLLKKIPFISNAIDQYEMIDFDYETFYDVEFISGCLMLIPVAVFEKCKGFDSRYFLYFEDADLSRNIRELGYRTVFSPLPEAIHEYQRGSHTSKKLFFIFIMSMIKYFNKWGWKWF